MLLLLVVRGWVPAPTTPGEDPGALATVPAALVAPAPLAADVPSGGIAEIPVPGGAAASAVPVLASGAPAVLQVPAVRLAGVAASSDPVAAALTDERVTFATAVVASEIAAATAGADPVTIRLAAVDPAGLRVLTPSATALADDLWQRLAEGAVVVDHRSAERLGVTLGEPLAIVGGPALRVGALAATGIEPVADVIVSAAAVPELLGSGSTELLVAVGEGVAPARVGEDLTALLGGSATLLPLPASTTGSAVLPPEPGGIWDALARCESSGNWQIDTGNGYYGGVQFSLSSWRLVGGSGYPHQSSREEQIARARILLGLQGWGAWPACSAKLGLRAAPYPPPVELPATPGAAPVAAPTDGSGRDDPAAGATAPATAPDPPGASGTSAPQPPPAPSSEAPAG